MTRISMDEYGFALADVVKLRAACTRRQVGAVIIGPDKRVVATGYNGTAPDQRECTDGGCPRGQFTHAEIPANLGNEANEVKCVAWHAEVNAIDWAKRVRAHLPDCTMYVTCQPCPHCRELIEKVGIKVVVR